MLNLFEEKENDRETIKEAYARYVKGQFGIDISHMVRKEHKIEHETLIEDFN